MSYKEFWISDHVIGKALIDDAKIRSSFDKPGDLREIHVIEYQAYEKLQKQNEKLIESVKNTSKILDNIKYDCYASVYTLTDEEFGDVFYARDILNLTLKEIEEK